MPTHLDILGKRRCGGGTVQRSQQTRCDAQHDGRIKACRVLPLGPISLGCSWPMATLVGPTLGLGVYDAFKRSCVASSPVSSCIIPASYEHAHHRHSKRVKTRLVMKESETLSIEDATMGTKVQPDEMPSAATGAAAAGEEDAKKTEAELPKCSYWKLFSNSDRFDSLLMAIGIVGSLCNGRAHASVVYQTCSAAGASLTAVPETPPASPAPWPIGCLGT